MTDEWRIDGEPMTGPTREVRYAEGRAWLERMHSRTCRVLRTAEEVSAASVEARDEYVRLFRARLGVSPCDEWLRRWWPLASMLEHPPT